MVDVLGTLSYTLGSVTDSAAGVVDYVATGTLASTLDGLILNASDVGSAVATLLRQSIQEHRRAQVLRRGGSTTDGHNALALAHSYRVAADALDPGHTAPYWTTEQDLSPNGVDTHATMMAFYTQMGL